MKITKFGSINIKKHIECPHCGETRSFLECLKEGKSQYGILSGIYKSYTEGFFHLKTMRADCYTCFTCGCEWESDPYEV